MDIIAYLGRNVGKFIDPTAVNRIIGGIVSLILRVPLFRFPYLFAMNCQTLPSVSRNLLGMGVRRAVRVNPKLSNDFRTGKALVIYYSRTGNTQKVAESIERGLKRGGLEPTIKKVSESFQEDYYNYDLVCLGTPVLHALPPQPIMRLIRKNFVMYRKRVEVMVPADPIPGKYAMVFVTFSGPHVGVDEALPAGKYVIQEFEHLGFEIKGEWYIVGEFHGWKTGSTRGKMGDIRGRPNAKDLARIEEEAAKLAKSLKGPRKRASRVMWTLT